MKMQNIRFGVNYVPSKNWWYSWMDWDGASILEDLQAIASLGMDHVRIHCLWSYFQPNATYVSEAALDRLEELMQLADQAGLDVQVTVLDGWLSGFAFFPAWRGRRNIFTDRAVVEGQKLLFTAIAERIGTHSRFLGFDVGNEINVLDNSNPVTLEQGDAWQRELLQHCELLAPGKFHVNGVDHNPWFRNRCFSRQGLSSLGASTSIHAWIEFTGALARYKPLHAGCVHLAEYCIELAKAYSPDHVRPIWLQEFGASAQWMLPDEVPQFAEETIRNALSCSNLWGCTWWCSHDLDPKFSEFHPLEYDLGLIGTGNRVKPAGERVASLIREFRFNPPQPPQRSVALVFPESVFEELKGEFVYPDNPGWRLGSRFMELVAVGVRPAIVLENRAGDTDYLAARGITELIQL